MGSLAEATGRLGQYTKPTITPLGSVSDLTRAAGFADEDDLFIVDGVEQLDPPTDGSPDIIINNN